jgi:hypothetical protein
VYGYGRHAFAFGFWLWSAFIAVGAGFLGTLLNCEAGEKWCKTGFPSWFQPWAWGDYYVYPEATIAALMALVPATAFVALVVGRRQSSAAAAFVLSLVLLSYAFFGGLTSDGRVLFSFGPLLGLAALGLTTPTGGTQPFVNRFRRDRPRL